jgi:hypothetical protein
VSALEDALADAGGVAAPPERAAELRRLLAEELDRGAGELAQGRSGYGEPVTVGIAAREGGLIGVAPVDFALRADPDAVSQRAWLLTAALVGALARAAGAPAPTSGADLHVEAGSLDRWLVVALPAGGQPDAELAALAFEEEATGIDRLRARALALPEHALAGAADLRAPIGAAHPLRVAEAVARLGGHPADEDSVAAHDDAVLALLEPAGAAVRPHADPDPARRAARRILQRLDGMGKWGGYHTDFAHLSRGFQGNERALAQEVGERLVAAGLLEEKRSVGQRHVFLNPRRVADIRALIERGDSPAGLELP